MDKSTQEEIDFLSRKILDLNKQLIESEKAKSGFISLITSELNNPMTALLGLLPHLAPSEEDEKYKIYEMLHSEALTLELRIQNLVSVAEIESGDIDISHAAVSMFAVLEDALAILKYLIRSKKMVIKIMSGFTNKIITDPRKLYIILTNLIANACIYGVEGGTVEIGFDAEPASIRIWVKNPGEGPKVQFKPQVFTRFAKSPEGEHGLGLGLSIVREFCECLEGKVDYSAEEGFVVFTIVLPLHNGQSTSDACGSNEFLFESFDDAIEI